MEKRTWELLRQRLIPEPRIADFRDGAPFVLENGCRVELSLPASGEECRRLFQAFWRTEPEIAAGPVAAVAPEGYDVDITAERLRISVSDPAGLRHALATLRQLAEPERNVLRFRHFLLAPGRISDAPALGFRAVHLCWFPESRVEELERSIRLAAFYKFNAVVIEPWGVFPFASHPEFCWPDRKVDRNEFSRLIGLGRSLGLEMVPQLNLLGHGSASRVCSGKHFFLDAHPELAALQEPDGWAWCLSNPETRRILADLALELHDFFGRPRHFHIGCDEAYNLATCLACRERDPAQLVAGHITFFHDLFAHRSTQCIMWHDMLLEIGDPRWEGCIVGGHDFNHLGELHRSLPHDLLIADWQYGKPHDGEVPWPTTRFFREQGFPVVVCPWLEPEGTLSLGRFAAREKLTGMIATTWHMATEVNLFKIFFFGAQGAWRGDYDDRFPWADNLQQFNCHVRMVNRDAGFSGYQNSGTAVWQLPPESSCVG